MNPFERCENFTEEEIKILDMVKENPDKYIFFTDNDHVSVRELNPEDFDENADLSIEEYEKYFEYTFNIFPEVFAAKFINYMGLHAEQA